MRILAIETASEACSVALFACEGESREVIAHDHRLLGRDIHHRKCFSRPDLRGFSHVGATLLPQEVESILFRQRKQ